MKRIARKHLRRKQIRRNARALAHAVTLPEAAEKIGSAIADLILERMQQPSDFIQRANIRPVDALP